MDQASLPSTSLASDKARLAAELGASFRRYGCSRSSHHGINRKLIERAWTLTPALPGRQEN